MELGTSSEDSVKVKYDDDSDDSLEESDEDYDNEEVPPPEGGVTWAEFYKDLKERDATTRGHFVSTLFRYLRQVGGCHSEEQALIQMQQVKIILDSLDPQLPCAQGRLGLPRQVC